MNGLHRLFCTYITYIYIIYLRIYIYREREIEIDTCKEIDMYITTYHKLLPGESSAHI